MMYLMIPLLVILGLFLLAYIGIRVVISIFRYLLFLNARVGNYDAILSVIKDFKDRHNIGIRLRLITLEKVLTIIKNNEDDKSTVNKARTINIIEKSISHLNSNGVRNEVLKIVNKKGKENFNLDLNDRLFAFIFAGISPFK